MIRVSNFSITYNSAVSARGFLLARSHSTLKYSNTSKAPSPLQTIKAIRLLIICAAMLISFFAGMIVHAVSGSDEVQAASLHSATTSQVSPSASVQVDAYTPAKQQLIVLDGDTLWSIAGQHAPKGQDIRAYIQKIKHTNQLTSSALQAGQILVLP